jgi:hypothetical protein
MEERETMHPLGKQFLTAVALVLLTSPARAQSPAGAVGASGLGGGPILLIIPNVQQELKLSDDQTRTVPQTIQEIMTRHRDMLLSLGDLAPSERVQRQRDLTRAMNVEAKKALSMSADQSRRFDQIGLQQRGIEAFTDADIRARLKLTDDQMVKIREIGTDALQNFQQIAQELGNDREGAMRKIRQLQKDLMVKAQAELTDEQKTAWKELAGEPFEIRFERRVN